MAQLKLTLNLRFFFYLFIILAIPVLLFLYKDDILNRYSSYNNYPYNLRVTNLTENSATVTWYTQSEDIGFVDLNGKKYSDDRDVLEAQKKSKLSQKDIEILPNKYFVHHVTIDNLKPETQYAFSIGNDVKTWQEKDLKTQVDWYDVPVTTSLTFKTLSDEGFNIQSPQLAYGKVTIKKNSGETVPSSDSIVFSQAYYGETEGEQRDTQTPQSLILSSVTNDNGGWTIDKSNFRKVDGEVLNNMITGLDKILVYAQLANYKTAPGRLLTWGLQDSPDQDFNYVEWEKKDELLGSNLVMKLYAQNSYPSMCCALRISGRSDYVGDWENAGKGPDCSIFDAAFMGQSLYGGTYEGQVQVNGITDRGSCEKSWSATEVDAQNAAYAVANPAPAPAPTPTPPAPAPTPTPPAPTPTPPAPTPTPPAPAPTPTPQPVNPGLYQAASDVKQTGNICCLIKVSGDTKWNRDFENGVQNQSCYDLWKNLKYGGKSIVSINQDPNARQSRDVCETGSSFVPNSTSSVGGIPCDTTVPEQKVDGVDKATFARKCHMVYNRGKSYGDVCFNDVVYKAKMAGVNPKLALIAWMHESGCSNYEAAGKVEDFGIHYGGNKYVSTTTKSYFPEQLDNFVCWGGHTAYKQCKASDPLVGWASYYWTGSTCDLAKGDTWLKDAKIEWSWFADPKDFPTSIKDTSADKYCENQKRVVPLDASNTNSFIQKLIPKALAQQFEEYFEEEEEDRVIEDNTMEFVKTDEKGDKYTLFFTQEGLYDIEIEGIRAYSIIGKPNTEYVFYKETNRKSGYQEGEDQLIEIDLTKVRVDQVTKVYDYEIQKGFNLYSFPFLPTKDNFSPLTASDFIKLVNQGSPGAVKGLVEFSNGKWNEAYLVDPITGDVMGEDFIINYGLGYSIIANRDATIQVPGTELLDPVPVSLQQNWNLVAVHGYEKEYTAQGLINSINNLNDVTVLNITSWDETKGKYESYKIQDENVFGFDFRIDPKKGYFIKVDIVNEYQEVVWKGD